MWIYLLVVVALFYTLFKERQSLGCPDIPNGDDCDNANCKAVRGTKPYPQDPTPIIYEKMRKAADFADQWVVWRFSFILATVSVIAIYFFLYQRLPDERELLISIFVIATVVYFTFNFYKFHLINYARDNIVDGIKILETR